MLRIFLSSTGLKLLESLSFKRRIHFLVVSVRFLFEELIHFKQKNLF